MINIGKLLNQEFGGGKGFACSKNTRVQESGMALVRYCKRNKKAIKN